MRGANVHKSLIAACALLCAACPADKPKPPVIDDCEGLTPVALAAGASKVRVAGTVPVFASGGTGYYTYRVEQGGSGGVMTGDRLLAGKTPGTDRIWVADAVCGTEASVAVEVIAPFDVAPTRAVIKPGTTFTISTAGMLGAPAFALVSAGSGATLSPEGVYVAGAADGLDLIAVKDTGTADEVVLQYRVSQSADFRAGAALWGVAAGASVPLTTLDGSDRVLWTKLSGPGALEGAQFRAAATDSGTAVLEVRDVFTGLTATTKVQVMGELLRSTRPHGRPSGNDVASVATGDFDGDGVPDVAVGFPESNLGRPGGGAVLVFRGNAAGGAPELAWTLPGQSDTAQFGAALAAGDLNADGKAELVVSAPGADLTVGDSGAVYLYTFTANGPEPLRAPLTAVGRGRFGASVAIADVNGDEEPDLLIGSPEGDVAPSQTVRRRGVVDAYVLPYREPIPEFSTWRISGVDLAADGTVEARSDVRAGRGLVVGDFNDDGLADLAVLGSVSNSLLGGVPVARRQTSVQVYFTREAGKRPEETPDLYVLPSDAADSNEGNWSLGFIPPEGGRPPFLLVVADRVNSPDLSGAGGVKSGNDSGGAFLFALTAHRPTGPASPQPVQLGLSDAWARIYGDTGGGLAGRSFALAEVDGAAGTDLVLGAPYATTRIDNVNQSLGGKLQVFPLAALQPGAVVNVPAAQRQGLKAHALGTGVASWRRADGNHGLIAVAGRASTSQGDFTGRVDFLFPGASTFEAWTAASTEVPARVASEQFGAAVAVTRVNGVRTSAVALPGFAGPGSNADGNDVGAGRVDLFSAAGGEPTVAVEGANSPLVRGGRTVGADVAFTDFDGDGRPDLVVGAPNLRVPRSSQAATEIVPVYAVEHPGCIADSDQSTGGVMVSLSRADGSFQPAFRLWAPTDLDGCAPQGDATCRRTGIGRAVAGGFDFNGDGRQDIAALRNNGLEVFLGRAPDDGQLTKLSMGCDPVLSIPYQPMPSFNLSAPVRVAALGDLDGDGCDEVGFRYAGSSGGTSVSGLLIAFGFNPDGGACGGTQAAWLRLSGDAEKNLPQLNLGGAAAAAGAFLADGRQLLAVSAGTFPVQGVNQQAVLLYDAVTLGARKPAGGEAVVGALNDGLTPTVLVPPTRTQTFGHALAGGVDVDADGVEDLVVSAPGASLSHEGSGAVFVYRGGAGVTEGRQPYAVLAGDGNERGQFGHSLSLVGPAAEDGTWLTIGAPWSDRTGTQNGTAFTVPLRP